MVEHIKFANGSDTWTFTSPHRESKEPRGHSVVVFKLCAVMPQAEEMPISQVGEGNKPTPAPRFKDTLNAKYFRLAFSFSVSYNLYLTSTKVCSNASWSVDDIVIGVSTFLPPSCNYGCRGIGMRIGQAEP
jgi:hypothetical protein